MMIDENTGRADLLSAIYGDGALIDHFMSLDLDPERMETDKVREVVVTWIEAGDETAN